MGHLIVDIVRAGAVLTKFEYINDTSPAFGNLLLWGGCEVAVRWLWGACEVVVRNRRGWVVLIFLVAQEQGGRSTMASNHGADSWFESLAMEEALLNEKEDVTADWRLSGRRISCENSRQTVELSHRHKRATTHWEQALRVAGRGHDSMTGRS
jgi:hypothetical protein